MASVKLHNDVEVLRVREKMYRRILIGRMDRGKISNGMMEAGLVTADQKRIKKKVSQMYRLTPHGVLYCLDTLDLSEDEIDLMAEQYASMFPRVFGRWKILKTSVGRSVYNKIQILSKAVFLDSSCTGQIPDIPLYELMSFVHTKYARSFESISEEDLTEQISYWFYTSMLYSPSPSNGARCMRQLQKTLGADPVLQGWYASFLKEAKSHYHGMFGAVAGSDIVKVILRGA